MKFKERHSGIFGVEGGGEIKPIYDVGKKEDIVSVTAEDIPEIQPLGEGIPPGKEVMLPRVDTSKLERPPKLQPQNAYVGENK